MSLALVGHRVPRCQKSGCPGSTAELSLEGAAWQWAGKDRPVSKGWSLSPATRLWPSLTRSSCKSWARKHVLQSRGVTIVEEPADKEPSVKRQEDRTENTNIR